METKTEISGELTALYDFVSEVEQFRVDIARLCIGACCFISGSMIAVWSICNVPW